MSFAKVRSLLGSIRVRLTIWNAAAVLLLVVLTLAGVREGLRRVLWTRLDQFLQEELAEIQDEIKERNSHWQEMSRDLDYKALDHPRRQLFIQIFSRSGQLLWNSQRTPVEPWANRLLRDFGMVERPTEYRILEGSIENQEIIIRVGVSTHQAEVDVKEFTKAMLMIGCGILIITPIVGYILADRAIRPISHIIDTANRLHPAQLNERLPVRGSHDELDRLSDTINGLLDRIARYIQQSREFNAYAAHELRSPLAAIRTSLEVTLLGDRTVEQYKEELADVLEEFDHLRVLVNKLLLLAEGDAGELCKVREPISIDQSVRISLDMFQAAAESQGVALKIERLEPATLSVDSTAFRQVVNNLLDNAIKYTPEGGCVAVNLFLDRSTGECVLSVRDTGVGISPADLPHVFERFYRADKSRPRDLAHRGTGLGLSICQAIVEAHGGSIAVESRVGEGTAFTIRFPVGKEKRSEEVLHLG
jgi:two-component system heavy metal sensor histidine kinase CusS